MNTNHARSILLIMLLVVALTVAAGAVSGCGPKDPFVGSWGTYGMLRIERSGDTYLIHDTANPFGNEYSGTLEGGKLVAKDGPATFVFTIEDDWLVQDGNLRFERN